MAGQNVIAFGEEFKNEQVAAQSEQAATTNAIRRISKEWLQRSTAWKEVVAVEKIFEKTQNRVGKVEEAMWEHAREIYPMKKI